MNRIKYNGFHLHCVLMCLHADNQKGAASWINRDIGEECSETEYAAEESLVLEDDGTVSYETVTEVHRGMQGEGI